jgi:uncharacterized protein YqgV (UPF0045/DUF77 family)
MRAAIEISMYPLGDGYIAHIEAFIDRLNSYPGWVVKTNAMSTQVWGELAPLLLAIGREIETAAQRSPQLVFVMKVLPGLAPP